MLIMRLLPDRQSKLQYTSNHFKYVIIIIMMLQIITHIHKLYVYLHVIALHHDNYKLVNFKSAK